MYFAQYGNRLSFYGNIQLGRFSIPLVQKTGFGGWPDDIPANSPMVNNIPLEEDASPQRVISDNIGLIKKLKAELEATQDTAQRQSIRLAMDAARAEKERQFRLMARIDEEDSTFILLH